MAVSRGERLGDALVAAVVAKSLRLHDAVTVRVETFARVAFGHQFGAHEVVELAEELGLVLHWIHEAVVRLRVDESCRVLVLVLERRPQTARKCLRRSCFRNAPAGALV